MKTLLIKQISRLFLVACSPILMNLLLSCQKEEFTPKEESILDAELSSRANANTSNGFLAFHQGFNHNTAAWADQFVEGPLGWCGTIELHNRKSGSISPSAGNGYATVMMGECNTFWSEEAEEMDLPLFQYGAPATQDPKLWSATWPSSGFVQDLDIYLDPDMFEPGMAFIYSSSLKAQDEMAFIYFAVNVVKEGDELKVEGYPVGEEGWYGFKFLFNDDGEGNLQVGFELEDNAKTVYSTYLSSDLGGENPTAGYSVDNYGSGYVWFVAIAEGVELPIDEYRLRPGQ